MQLNLVPLFEPGLMSLECRCGAKLGNLVQTPNQVALWFNLVDAFQSSKLLVRWCAGPSWCERLYAELTRPTWVNACG